MTSPPLTALAVVVLVAALGWKLWQLRRGPRGMPLRWVTFCLAASAVSVPFHLPAGARLVDAAITGGTAKLVQNWLQMACLYCLMVFFLYSADDGAARRRACRAGLLFAVVGIGMAVALAATPPPTRADSFTSADMTSAPVAGFYLLGISAFVFALTTSAMWAWRYAQSAHRHLAIGLRVTAMGLGVIAVAGTVRFVIALARWAEAGVPRLVEDTTAETLIVGGVIFFGGVTYPGVMARVAAVRLWRQHRRTYHRLWPLWRLLHDAFPDDALQRVPTGWAGRVSLRDVHRRCYRRVIECRDGLVQLSPHLAELRQTAGPPTTPAEQANRVHEALRRHAEGTPVSAAPITVVAPATPGLDADAAELVALADALSTHPPASVPHTQGAS
ncbi:MAG: MAB_1171c family putative transporter [Pseudonocardiaceae bacterium]